MTAMFRRHLDKRVFDNASRTLSRLLPVLPLTGKAAKLMGAVYAAQARGALRQTGKLIGPVAIYDVDLRKLRAASLLSQVASRVGWRFVFAVRDYPVATVDCPLDDRRPGLVADGESARRFLSGMQRMLEEAKIRGWSRGRHELRLIRIPALHTSALWVPSVRRGVLLLRRRGLEHPDGNAGLLDQAEFAAWLRAARKQARLLERVNEI